MTLRPRSYRRGCGGRRAGRAGDRRSRTRGWRRLEPGYPRTSQWARRNRLTPLLAPGRPPQPLALRNALRCVLVCRGAEHSLPVREVGTGNAAAGMRVASHAGTRSGSVAFAAGPGDGTRPARLPRHHARVVGQQPRCSWPGMRHAAPVHRPARRLTPAADRRLGMRGRPQAEIIASRNGPGLKESGLVSHRVGGREVRSMSDLIPAPSADR